MSMPTCKEGQLEKAVAVLTVGTLAEGDGAFQLCLACVLYMVVGNVERQNGWCILQLLIMHVGTVSFVACRNQVTKLQAACGTCPSA